MTTTSLKHIVSNVENIRNPVITHCYYGNQHLLSSSLFLLCLCFPSVLCAFYSCSFLLQPVFVSRFCNPSLVPRFRPPSHLSCASFCIPSFRSSSLSAFCLFGKRLSFGSDQWYADAFRTLCLVSAPFISSFLRNII